MIVTFVYTNPFVFEFCFVAIRFLCIAYGLACDDQVKEEQLVAELWKFGHLGF